MKRDANEKAIISALRKCGFLVQQIDQGGGVPDLLVCVGGRVVLLEVKDGPKKKLTPAQQKWHAQWEGAPVFVVDSVESALAAVQDIDPQVKRVRELEDKLRRVEDKLSHVRSVTSKRGSDYEMRIAELEECLRRWENFAYVNEAKGQELGPIVSSTVAETRALLAKCVTVDIEALLTSSK